VDRRALFFLTAAVMAGILTVLVHDDLVYVPRAVAITYLVLAVASWLDWRSANGH
jgi:heme A synthase